MSESELLQLLQGLRQLQVRQLWRLVLENLLLLLERQRLCLNMVLADRERLEKLRLFYFYHLSYYAE